MTAFDARAEADAIMDAAFDPSWRQLKTRRAHRDRIESALIAARENAREGMREEAAALCARLAEDAFRRGDRSQDFDRAERAIRSLPAKET